MNSNNFITLIIKMIGTQCNMRCEYCYEHALGDNVHKKTSTSSDVIEYLKNFLDYHNVFILFHGGEPFLANYNEVAIVANFIKNNFRHNYRVQFQTNGTLLNDNWIGLMESFGDRISLSISLDPIGKRDLRHSNSFDYRKKVIENLKKYVSRIDNVGIVSVIHKYNVLDYENFIIEMNKIGLKNFTANKYKGNLGVAISELEYVDFLKKIAIKYIKNKWYKTINLEPINSLFSKKNKLCIYMADDNKCSYFKTFYGVRDSSEYCDHVVNKNILKIGKQCKNCSVYSFCGGGCLAEIKDETFCDARKELYNFIQRIKHENN